MNNGEWTFEKAYKQVKHGAIPNEHKEMEKYITAASFLDELFEEITKSMEWMVTHFKWKHRQQLGMEDEYKYPDSEIDWSPELRKAMEILEKLKV